MGKSGHIGAKTAATFASTGTPAFFVHPAEAVHGDLGMMTGTSAVLALSHSGATDEVLNLLPYIRHSHIPLIVVTGNPTGPLAAKADVVLSYCLDQEACPLNLAPTASTITQMAICDALAGAVMEMRGFTHEDFALRHPLGTLGRRLLMHVGDLMATGDDNPVMPETATLKEAISRMMSMGAVSFVGSDGRLTGIFCDGDLRRLFQRGGADPDALMRDIMVHNPKRITADLPGTKAVDMMQQYKISVLPVVDDDLRPVGMVDLKTLNRAGLAG
jgi:arabinose-5-phosphate isomerase